MTAFGDSYLSAYVSSVHLSSTHANFWISLDGTESCCAKRATVRDTTLSFETSLQKPVGNIAAGWSTVIYTNGDYIAHMVVWRRKKRRHGKFPSLKMTSVWPLLHGSLFHTIKHTHSNTHILTHMVWWCCWCWHICALGQELLHWHWLLFYPSPANTSQHHPAYQCTTSTRRGWRWRGERVGGEDMDWSDYFHIQPAGKTSNILTAILFNYSCALETYKSS